MQVELESFKIMLNELKSSIELNKIKQEQIDKLKEENIKLKTDLIYLTTKDK